MLGSLKSVLVSHAYIIKSPAFPTIEPPLFIVAGFPIGSCAAVKLLESVIPLTRTSVRVLTTCCLYFAKKVLEILFAFSSSKASTSLTPIPFATKALLKTSIVDGSSSQFK